MAHSTASVNQQHVIKQPVRRPPREKQRWDAWKAIKVLYVAKGKSDVDLARLAGVHGLWGLYEEQGGYTWAWMDAFLTWHDFHYGLTPEERCALVAWARCIVTMFDVGLPEERSR